MPKQPASTFIPLTDPALTVFVPTTQTIAPSPFDATTVNITQIDQRSTQTYKINNPGGSATQVQINIDGKFVGDDGMTYNTTSDSLTIAGAVNAGSIFTDTLKYANGTTWSFPGTFTTANVASYLPTYSGSVTALTVAGAFSAATLGGDGGNLSNIQGANVSGAVATATTAGTVTSAAQANITSTGTLTVLTVDGQTTLGPVANVHISGGTAAQVLSTDGAGNLSWATSSGGGSSEVEYTLTTMPGHGIVPLEVVADYTAFLASVTVGWIEITAGESGFTELVYKDGATYYGPFGDWIKNPRYRVGDNGETKLIVEFDRAVQVPNWVNSRNSSLYASDALDTSAGDTSYRIRRTNSMIPIYPPVAPAVGDKFTVVNRSTYDQHDAWLGVINTSSIRITSTKNTVIAQLFSAGELVTDDRYYNATALWYNGSSATFERTNLLSEVLDYWILDDGEYQGMAGIPARYTASSTNYGHFLATWALSTTGVLEWDYRAFELRYLKDHDNTVAKSEGSVLTYNGTSSKWEARDSLTVTGDATANNVIATFMVKTTPTTLELLGSAATAGAGARAWVTNSDNTLVSANLLTICANTGSGANSVPVFSDGTNWLIG